MMIKRLARWIGIAILALLAGTAVAGKARLIRPDILSALACTPELLGDGTFGRDALLAHRDTMQAEASAHDLPPELLAMVIIGHQTYQTPLRDFTDCAGSALGANLSLGLAQLRMSTAVENSGAFLAEISHREFHRWRSELLAPESNIHYAARELRALLDRPNRFPGTTAGELLEDPFRLALLASEYRAGWADTPVGSSRQSANAFADMRFLLGEEVYLFGRDPGEVSRIRDRFRDYLDYIYCESGIFNDGVCTDWRPSPARNGNAMN